MTHQGRTEGGKMACCDSESDAEIGAQITITVPKQAFEMAKHLLSTGLFGRTIGDVFSELAMQSLRSQSTQAIISATKEQG